jgi:fluoroacetyl-CoA thioesterase
VEDTVNDFMLPAFDGRVVHPVYGTAAMVYHMEWAARHVILPYLDDGEEGIGTGVRVRHLHPAPKGATIRACAECTRIEDNIVICEVKVYHGDHLLGDGEVEQRIIPKRMLHERFPDCWVHYGDALDGQ